MAAMSFGTQGAPKPVFLPRQKKNVENGGFQRNSHYLMESLALVKTICEIPIFVA